MKLYVCSALLLLTAAMCSSQSPAKASGSAGSESDCGPIGCISGAGAGSAQAASAAPVVIRTGDAGAVASEAPRQPAVAQPQLLDDTPTAFEGFVAASLGHPLKVFGRDLFSKAASSFAPPTNVAPTADYIVSTGDQIVIRTWGKVDIDAHVTVDKNGQIFIPRVGVVTVAGVRYSDLSEFLHNSIAQQFKGFELAVSLAQLRSIQVFVLGQARAPGLYTVSSLSTLINALFLSGGPSSAGTLRDIQIKRGNAVVTHLDVYDLLLHGDKAKDAQLLPGDIIYIPRLGPQVALDGDVANPGIYELRGTESVASVLQYAGGLTVVGGTARAVLEHVVDHDRRTIEELALNERGLSIPMTNGDILRTFPISARIEGAVTLRGPVAFPGRYAWHPGMRISDLIPSPESLIPRDYYNRQNTSTDPANVGFQASGGTASVKTAPDNVSAVSATGAQDNDSGSGLEDRNGFEIDWTHAAIERLDTVKLTPTLIPFALRDAITQPGSAANLNLQAGDSVLVYSRKDLNLPLELETKFVKIDGQVNAPGVYQVRGDQTLQDLVALAGGVAPHAYLYGSQLTRASVRAQQELQLRELVARESREVYSPSNTSTLLQGQSSNNSGELELRRAYITELSKLRATGRVAVDIDYSAKTAADVPAMLLEDGDHFFVPQIPTTVSVLGRVYNQGAYRYRDGSRISTYLDAAGGATRDADKSREFILRADGSLLSKQSSGHFDKSLLHPGDTLLVPTILRSNTRLANILNLEQLGSTLSLGVLAAAIAVR